MKRVIALVCMGGMAVGLAACGGGSSGASTPNGVMAAVASDLQSGNLAGVCSLAQPSDQSSCNSALQKASTEIGQKDAKITFKDVTYSVGNANANSATAKLGYTVCVSAPSVNETCEHQQSNTGQLVNQNGTWYITEQLVSGSNSSGNSGSGNSGNSGSSRGSGNSGSGNSRGSGNSGSGNSRGSGNSGSGNSGSGSGNSGNSGNSGSLGNSGNS